jgi:hypothetical protein
MKSTTILRTACELAGPEGRVGGRCKNPTSQLHTCLGEGCQEVQRPPQWATVWFGVKTPGHWVWVAKTLKSSRFCLTGVCLGHRLCSSSHIPGAGHSTLYRTFSDRDRNALWIRWESSLNTAAMHDRVPSGSQAILHRGGPHSTCLQHGRTAGCAPPPLNSCLDAHFARATLAFSSHGR